MGSVIRRGTRDKPRWYASFKDADGGRKTRALPGVHTREEAKKALAVIESNVTQGRIGIEPRKAAERVEPLMRTYVEGLRNRSSDKTKGRIENHVLPTFGPMTMAQAQERSAVVLWLDRQRAAGLLAEGSIRGNIVALSGFWNWAIARGLADINPTRSIPKDLVPKRKSRQSDVPWIQDDATVWKVMDLLASPFREAFFLGNRSGLRPGELAGLRMSDIAFLHEGVIRVRFSFQGPIKEDKDGGKTKWVPASVDAIKVLGPLIEQRNAAGAKPEDVLFWYVPEEGRERKDPTWEGLTIDAIDSRWEKVRTKLGLSEMRWYEATRHSFVSRALAAGASMDEVSAAVGHSSIMVTRQAYDHFERRSWGDVVRSPLQPRKKVAATKTDAAADVDAGQGTSGSRPPNSRRRHRK